MNSQLEFGRFVREASSAGSLVVQPRMGFSDPARMRDGLLATRDSAAQSVGTITVDSYTRIGDHASAARAVANGEGLNGYPIVTIPTSTTRTVLAGVHDDTFPVQVRHGSARPQAIVDALIRAGLTPPRAARSPTACPTAGPRCASRCATGPGAASCWPSSANRMRAAPGDLRRLPDGPALPAEPAGRDERAGGGVLRAARAAQHLAELRAADPPRAGRARPSPRCTGWPRIPAPRPIATSSSTPTWGSTRAPDGALGAAGTARPGSLCGPGRPG